MVVDLLKITAKKKKKKKIKKIKLKIFQSMRKTTRIWLTFY